MHFSFKKLKIDHIFNTFAFKLKQIAPKIGEIERDTFDKGWN